MRQEMNLYQRKNLVATFQESGLLMFGVGAAITLVPMLIATVLPNNTPSTIPIAFGKKSVSDNFFALFPSRRAIPLSPSFSPTWNIYSYCFYRVARRRLYTSSTSAKKRSSPNWRSNWLAGPDIDQIMLGTITGGMTSTPGLAAADSMVDSNIPSVAYATVYPIAMVPECNHSMIWSMRMCMLWTTEQQTQ